MSLTSRSALLVQRSIRVSARDCGAVLSLTGLTSSRALTGLTTSFLRKFSVNYLGTSTALL